MSPGCPLPRPRRSQAPALRRVGVLIAVSLSVLLVPQAWAQPTNITYGVPWGQCQLGVQARVAESVGAVTDDLVSLCLRSNSPTTTFDNADKFFIGNSSNPDIKGFGVLCAPLNPNKGLGRVYQVTLPTNESTFKFAPGNIPGITLVSQQSWELSVWDSTDTDANTTVDLTISNFGPTALQFTGIDPALLGLENDTVFDTGNVTTLELDLAQVANAITYDGLDILQAYLYGPNDLPANIPTAVLFVADSDPSSNPDPNTFNFLTYSLVLDNKGVGTDRFKYYLYESTFSLNPSGGTGGRRLLVAAAKSKAPPAACAKGCCKPASPLPKGCSKGGKEWPTCSQRCGCSCK